MTIDSISMFVEHEKEQDLTDLKFIRRHLVGISDSSEAIIRADNPKQALEILFNEWVGFKIEEGVKPACLISNRKPIVEYTNCKDIVDMKNGWFGCKKGEWNGRLSPNKKSYCGCILDRYDPPSNCPISNEMDLMDTNYVEEVVEGYTFRRHGFKVNTKKLTDDVTKSLLVDHHKQNIIKTILTTSDKDIVNTISSDVNKLKQLLSDE